MKICRCGVDVSRAGGARLKAGGERGGFTFTEILIAVIILVVGLLPLMWALVGGSRQTRITIKQVQAANHAANLLEALRTIPFKKLAAFPPCMVQTGRDGKWHPPSEVAGEVEPVLADIAESPPPPQAAEVFEEFVNDFFAGDVPMVPPMGRNFVRYFVLIKDDPVKPTYITVVVRVEWKVRDIFRRGKERGEGGTAGSNPEKRRYVELRTVMADPYFYGG